jgi:queuine tRNA-ribosyltransferase
MFKVLEKKGKRRLGRLSTMHGDIYTPAFGPDATRGLIRNIAPHEVFNLRGDFSPLEIRDLLDSYFKDDIEKKFRDRDILKLLDNKYRRETNETQFMLSNTYHLRSYPGDEFIKKAGGIHKFVNWPLPILTDSGGFQVFSLIHGAKNLKGKVTDDGAFFNNPVTGERLELTPENAIDIQFNLGSDIMVVLDDCRHYQDNKELKKSVYRTIEWAKRCKKRFEEIINVPDYKYIHRDNLRSQVKRPLLFCVVQGGIDYDLRQYCVDELTKIGFDGYGFGGWAINEKEYFPYDLLKFVAERLPEDKPRYAMGIGNPDNMKLCIDFGYDLFDCVIPSRNGRHGLAYTTNGDIRIQNAKYKTDKDFLDDKLESLASKYSKEYLYHLFKIGDSLGGEILTLQNLAFFNYLMR